MLFVIFLGLAILCIFILYYIDNHYSVFSEWQDIVAISAILYLVGFILVHTIFGCINIYNMTSLGKDNFQIKYENLKTYKNNDYVAPDIIEWNKDVEYCKKHAHDFWIGPYISNIYDNLEIIE